MSPQDVTAHFHRKIPISRDMGLKVIEVSSRSAVVGVPLSPNINHVQTAFGGSLYAAAALACYALFQALSQEAGGLSDELVIQEGAIRYLKPVTSDFEAHAEALRGEHQTSDAIQGFLASLQRHGKARIRLKATVLCQGETCAVFEGTYVYKSGS